MLSNGVREAATDFTLEVNFGESIIEPCNSNCKE